MRLGLLGGTFNPIHNGHLTLARRTRDALDLDRILLIPTGDPPHKPDHILAPARDRYEMARLAIQQDPDFEVSDIEIRRVGKSYTIDTIRLLFDLYGSETELFFIIGIDAFLEFPSWKHPDDLLRSCNFVVVSRPGSKFSPLLHMPPFSSMLAAPSTSGMNLHEQVAKFSLLDAHQQHRLDISIPEGKRVVLLDFPPCEISASDIRAKVCQGLPVVNLLPPLVESYIIQHHLY